MATVLVNIVSAQTIPNFLFIKEFQEEADLFLFISTINMEAQKKTKTVYETARLDKNSVRKILINEDELYLAKSKLDHLGWKNAGHRYLVNITGGTKLMSNAVYEYFKQYDSRFFYLPIGKNMLEEIYDAKPASRSGIGYKISIYEYLSLHDIHFEEKEIALPEKTAMEIFSAYRDSGFRDFPYGRMNLPTGMRQKPGTWFETFLFYKIKKTLGLTPDAIRLNIRLFQKKAENSFSESRTDNELDVVFIYNNSIYLVEAKVSLGNNKVNTTILTHALYKLAAINKRFGLNARAMLMTLADFSTLADNARANIEKRCDLLDLPFPFDRAVFENDQFFKAKLKLIV